MNRIPMELLIVATLACCAAHSRAAGAAEVDPASRAEFAEVDADGNGSLDKAEARRAGLLRLVSSWARADTDADHHVSPPEFEAFARDGAQTPAPGGERLVMQVGTGKLKSPETALWDEKADVYLVSNVNGPLTARDGNGFISRISPDGRIEKVRWIRSGSNGVTLNGPKGMLFSGDELIVADVKTVRFFHRVTGDPVRQVKIPQAHMLNDLAMDGQSGTLYVTDTGGPLVDNPGTVYAIGRDGSTSVVAEGSELDRPDGLLWRDGALLVTPFGAEANALYRLDLDGRRRTVARMPHPQLDGLLELPDDSLLVTSWTGKAVYRLQGKDVTVAAEGVTSPAQIGYDGKRQRLLVPSLKKHELYVVDLAL